MRQLEIYQNAYYNYRKHWEADYYTQKSEVMAPIKNTYHSHNGVNGYQSIKAYPARRGYDYSPATIHKYINIELSLRSIVRPKSWDMNTGRRTRYLKIS